MKIFLVAIVSVTAIVWISAIALTRPTANEEESSAPVAKWSHRADKELTDAPEVFRQAFWAHPSKEDVIDHAVRLHWLDDGEVYKWQWYVQVQPSAGLVDRLITRNSFRLDSVTDVELPANPPTWFSALENSQKLSSRDGDMTILFDAESNLMVAYGQGKGFNQEVAEAPAKPVREVEKLPRRLPNSRPPTNRRTNRGSSD